MKCMTHCGEDVDYERHEFPNGLYVVPRNKDQSIHLCERLHQYDDDTNLMVPINHADFELGNNDLGVFFYEFQYLSMEVTDEEIKKNKKFANQVLNYLFFLNNHLCSDPYLENLISQTGLSYDTTTELENLSIISKIYELQNDFESAIQCEIIKFEIDGSITKNFGELVRKNNENYSKEESYSAAAIRYKLKIVENALINLIRTKIDETTLKQFFPTAYDNAVENRNKAKSIQPEKNDLLDWMDFGTCRFVLGNWKKEAPKELQFQIKPISSSLDLLNDLRNRNDHYNKPPPLDEFMGENERIARSLICDECIEYLKDQISKAT